MTLDLATIDVRLLGGFRVSVAGGALVVDIRPAAQRAAEGELGFGLVVERNVLEWRFDLSGGDALAEVSGYDQPVVVVCSEGYASSLAAASRCRRARGTPAACP